MLKKLEEWEVIIGDTEPLYHNVYSINNNHNAGPKLLGHKSVNLSHIK